MIFEVAFRQLSSANGAQGKSMEKLSSGLRINRAGDDAAGLAISEKMRGQIRGLDQASANAQDGISMIQTAEGALSETHSILQRMRELSVQASNETLTTDDREKIQKEVNQLVDEIDKIGNQTEFNTKKLLNGEIGTTATSTNKFSDGTAKTAVTVLGTTEETQSTTATAAVSLTTAGKQSYTADAAWGGGIQAGDTFTVTSNGKDTTYSLSVGDDQRAILDKVNALTDETGIEAYISEAGGVSLRATQSGTQYDISVSDSRGGAVKTAIGIGAAQAGVDAVITFAGTTYDTTGAGANNLADVVGNTVTLAEGDQKGLSFKFEGVQETAKLSGFKINTASANGDTIDINGTTINLTAGQVTTDQDFVDVINSATRKTGVQASLEGGAIKLETLSAGDNVGIDLTITGTLDLNEADGTTAIAAATTAGINASGSGVYAAGTDNIDDGGVGNGTNIDVKADDVTFHVGANSGQTMDLSVGDMRASALGKGADVSAANQATLTSVSDLKTNGGLLTSDKAEDAIKILDEAIKNVSEERGNLGATQNRLEHTINNLSTSSENLTAAESRIRDVDMAKEMMAQTKNSILSQAAQAMLAQANQQPQGVLQLLR